MIKTLNALRTVKSTPYRKRRHHVSVFFLLRRGSRDPAVRGRTRHSQ